MNLKEINNAGKAIGMSLTLSLNQITNLQSYKYNYDYAINKEKELRNNQNYSKLYKSIFESYTPENKEIMLESYFSGLKYGIKEALKKKGIREDDKHLTLLTKNQRMRQYFVHVNDFVTNNQNKSHVINNEFAVIISTLQIVLRLSKLRNSEYMKKRISFIMEKIVNDPLIKKEIERHIKESLSDYVEYSNFEIGQTSMIPEEIFNPPTNSYISMPNINNDQNIEKFWKG